ncbi:MAG TPA: 50S ribosomal protein L21 [Elusimicrobiota bacterium]|jgi:large subunit ribosomal protein L21|nr:50S ribosomal protein L21 [Elusimicrobiota bacterium]HMU95806.1 50S ribosomal protein L21 [Elusimicrobiota bacterium]HMX43434.1 50S ribosomal protein L21 [Elusimicrobiota bacterium]HMX95481.1 50S ribosomal protein L21 [Elusimicrobiota bacterium]HMZ26784.1 50S ribosomal protein L21 [Elusimicrobiota bacterium]
MTEQTTYAVIRTGGKQYRVTTGEKLKIQKLPEAAGDAVTFSEVLLVKDGDALKTGRPTVAGAAVKGQVLRQFRDKKVLVFKKRRKKGYKKLQGHRQDLTEVLIESIQTGN